MSAFDLPLRSADVGGAKSFKSVRSNPSTSSSSSSSRQQVKERGETIARQAEMIAKQAADLAEVRAMMEEMKAASKPPEKSIAAPPEVPKAKPPDLPVPPAPPGMVPVTVADAVLATHVEGVKAEAGAYVAEVEHKAFEAVGEATKARDHVAHEATAALSSKDLELHALQTQLAQLQVRGNQVQSEAKMREDSLQAQLLKTQAEVQEREKLAKTYWTKGQNLSKELAELRNVPLAVTPAIAGQLTLQEMMASLTTALSSAVNGKPKADKFGLQDNSLKKVPRFEGKKSRSDEASIWFKRLECAAREDNWFA